MHSAVCARCQCVVGLFRLPLPAAYPGRIHVAIALKMHQRAAKAVLHLIGGSRGSEILPAAAFETDLELI